MPTYVALLRGINVSGQKLIKMAELRAQLAELPYDNIRTYIQSGNILFEREAAEPAVIEEEVRQLIAKHYGFDVPVMVKTREDLDYVVNNHPFIHERNEDPKFVHVTFLAEEPDPERVAKHGENAPMGRPGQPNEVAPCHLFLACDDSSYMTGQVLHPNGGTVVGG